MSFDTSLWEKILQDKYQKREKTRKEILYATVIKLKEYFSRKEIKNLYIIGSILREGMFYDFSDIDIAVEGLTGNYFETSCELEHILDRNIELIEIEKCSFKEKIKKEGLKIL